MITFCVMTHWYPPVGVFIAFLGLLAVLVPWLREKKAGKPEKALWTAVMFTLMLLEIRSIYLDRKAHDKEQEDARGLQLANFQRIAGGIETAIDQNQKHFNLTMAGLGSVLGKEGRIARTASRSLEQMTGGDEYCYVVPVPPINGVGTNWQLIVGNSGGVVLPSCDIRMVELPMPGDSPEEAIRKFDQSPITFLTVPPRQHGAHFTQYLIGAGPGRKYTMTITTPTRAFLGTIEFLADSKNRLGYTASCEVRSLDGKVLKSGCGTLRP